MGASGHESSPRASSAASATQQREIEQLVTQVDRGAQECEQLRQFIHQQAAKANATILEMAKRNLALETELREARGQQGHPQSRLQGRAGSADDARRRSASGPPRLHGPPPEAAGSTGEAGRAGLERRLPASPFPGPSVRIASRGRPQAEPSGLSSVPWTESESAEVPDASRSLSTGSLLWTGHTHSLSSAVLPSPYVGIDGRYTGRRVASTTTPRRPCSDGRGSRGRPSSGGTPSLRRVASSSSALQRTLDVASAEMRRLQQRSRVAAR